MILLVPASSSGLAPVIYRNHFGVGLLVEGMRAELSFIFTRHQIELRLAEINDSDWRTKDAEAGNPDSVASLGLE